MKYIFRLILSSLLSLLLCSCGGGGGGAGCSLAVGALACSGGGSSTITASAAPTVSTSYSLLHSMASSSEGASPQATMIQVGGVFYGTTQSGGLGYGGVYSVNTAGQVTLIHAFTGGTSDGAIPFAGLVLGSDGNLYGTTTNGGLNKNGTVFKVALSSGVASWAGVVYSFGASNSGDGAGPFGGLIQGSDGVFYGTTFQGGANNLGTVYRITLIGGVVAETPIYSFGTLANVDGAYPQSSLIRDSSGVMYGTTSSVGSSSGTAIGGGTVFAINTAGNLTTLHTFAGGTTDGATPYSPLLLGADGFIYGTTTAGNDSGSTANAGVVFRLSTAGAGYKVIYSFNGTTIDGSSPAGNLLQINNVIYGTTQNGGNYGKGTIFSVTTLGVENMVYSFGSNSDGATPYAGLTAGADGYYYGVTSSGGANSSGAIYKFHP